MLEENAKKPITASEYNLFKGEVTYKDIPATKVMSTMFLSPMRLRRYGELCSIRVEVSYQGRSIAEITKPKIKEAAWWTKEPTGALLRRSETVFKLWPLPQGACELQAPRILELRNHLH